MTTMTTFHSINVSEFNQESVYYDAGFELSDNPLSLSANMNTKSYTSEYLAHFTVQNAPVMSLLELQGSEAGVIGYMLTQEQYDDWYNSRPSPPTSWYDYFELNISIHFEYLFTENDDYYIILYNLADYTIDVSGSWMVDIWNPEIHHNYTANQHVSGIQRMVVNSTDDFTIRYTALLIHEYLVRNETGDSLIYQWNTLNYPDGPITLTFIAEDYSGNRVEDIVNLVIDNISESNDTPTENGSPFGVVFVVSIFIGIIAIATVVSEVRTRTTK
ncbi:MAG: hypothetical protein ACTSWA_05920 [Candidatus Thorarchaeota archaeon]